MLLVGHPVGVTTALLLTAAIAAEPAQGGHLEALLLPLFAHRLALAPGVRDADAVLAACPSSTLTYGRSPAADVRPLELVQDLAGTRMRVRLPDGDLLLESPLIGSFNGRFHTGNVSNFA